jgi:GT2 family glycosyltransferase
MENMPTTGRPFFSVIVPTYKRPRSLTNLLNALTCQSFSLHDIEVIVVDDGGGIDLLAVLSPFRKTLDLTIIDQKNAGPAAARNHGARLARGAVLAFIDDDCEPHIRWLERLAKTIEKNPDCICGGKTVNSLTDNPFSQATQMLMDFVYREYKPENNLGAFFMGNNLAVRRKEFFDLGGFDPTLRYGEDREFCYRWVSSQRTLVFSPNAVVYHAHFLTFPSFLALHFHYGVGTSYLRKRCHQQGLKRVKLGPASYYIDLMLMPYKATNKYTQRLFMSALLLASQIAYILGYLWDSSKVLPGKPT